LSDVISTQRAGRTLKEILSLNSVENMPLLYSNDVNLFDRNTEALSVASKETGLQGKPYMIISRHKRAGQNRNVKIAKKLDRSLLGCDVI
jgi:hypothetical protein